LQKRRNEFLAVKYRHNWFQNQVVDIKEFLSKNKMEATRSSSVRPSPECNRFTLSAAVASCPRGQGQGFFNTASNLVPQTDIYPEEAALNLLNRKSEGEVLTGVIIKWLKVRDKRGLLII